MLSQGNMKLAQFNAEAIPVNVIWKRAKLAASDAVMEYVEKNGEPMYCGFANIKIKPARGRLVKYLKEQQIWDLHHHMVAVGTEYPTMN